MTGTIGISQDFKELAHFLAELNNQKAFHIGYCGLQADEIYETLQEDFVGDDGKISFLVARNSYGEIEAAIGLDIDEDTAEVWGPFNINAALTAQNQLWERLMQEYPKVRIFYFFLNKENIKQQDFMNMIQATKTGEHLILELERDNFVTLQNRKSTDFIQNDFQAFEALQSAAFPNTYYSAQTIASRLNEEHILKILKSEAGEMLGYAYYEVDLDMNEADLHYFAIAPAAQNQGYGTLLLKEVVTEIFNFSEINEMKLCVEAKNDKANHVYFKAGFVERDLLYSYKFNRSNERK
ncbi:GNAT family N-acetyltransferase [Ureibacillus chungkukjangi]|uniref:N-acetyltransferase domain-containing protein n=1 Tax=Ureibacillus chungkukjangi TaxID=1202712 RepID=A0A318TUF9_9BACL|nr:GNAT family N-acetyltransferase [Ureibacillus chungkukjangi]PYF08284.1 hypothetical protein BJ095_10249 [Ureibacillus chungkukjangi]